MSELCECQPGRFHPKKSHLPDGCSVTIYGTGRCSCKRTYS